MADSTTPIQQIVAGAGADSNVNENFDAASPAMVYGRNAATTSGLTWGYIGGRWSGHAIANGTVALTASSDNYVVVALTTGAVSVSTATTNWNDTVNYARAYKVVTGTGTVTSYEDHRAGTGGTQNAAASSVTPIGLHAVFVSAAAMQPSVSGGCAALASAASGANLPDIVSLDFDPTTQEYAQFSLAMPKSWNEGTVTFKPIWSHAATTVNFGTVWSLQGVAVSNSDPIAAAFGTVQTSTDTGGTTDTLYQGPASSAITVAGTPAAEDVVFFRISRVTGDAADTMAIDARLHGIVLYITTDAATDA